MNTESTTDMQITARNQSVAYQTGNIVAAFVAHNNMQAGNVPGFIADVHKAVAAMYAPAVESAPAQEPAVPIKKSITPDFIICLEDGKKFKSLKRHLSSLGMTPDAYRAKWGLPADYPMAAPNYSATRSDLAKQHGLGRKTAP